MRDEGKGKRQMRGSLLGTITNNMDWGSYECYYDWYMI